ncbi:hypothetical protein IG631_16003 [Alternaria alternata]|nr:hypothetical protein IG631_16003 [Alternaria alternata]
MSRQAYRSKVPSMGDYTHMRRATQWIQCNALNGPIVLVVAEKVTNSRLSSAYQSERQANRYRQGRMVLCWTRLPVLVGQLRAVPRNTTLRSIQLLRRNSYRCIHITTLLAPRDLARHVDIWKINVA